MIGVLNYGVGNVNAFLNVYKRLGINAKAITKPSDFYNVSHLILPGVGSFDNAINKFNESGLRIPTEKMILHSNIPLLGVCVGMQMLASISEEGSEKGLDLIPGKVQYLKNYNNCNLPLPHMGWNKIEVINSNKLTIGLENAYFYYLHSFVYNSDSKSAIMATSDYDGKFEVIVNKDNIYGMQCHPEKSHKFGSIILKNFSKI